MKIFPFHGSRLTVNGLLLVYWPILALPLILGGARPFLWSFTASVFLAGFALLLLFSRGSFGETGSRNQEAGSAKETVVESGREPEMEGWAADRTWRDTGKNRMRGLTHFLRLPASPRLRAGICLFPILAWPFVQIIPLPLPLLSVLSPQRAAWVHRAMEATGRPVWWACLSYVPLDTFMTGLWILTLALFALVLHHSLREGIVRPQRLLTVLFAVAGVEAFYGIIQVLVPMAGLGFQPGRATGTFANSDHFAAFLGMIWPLQLAMIAGKGLGVRSQGKDSLRSGSGVRGKGPAPSRQARDTRLPAAGRGSNASFEEKESLRKTREKRIFFIFLTGMVLLALVFSQSRGGIISLAIGTTVLAYLGGKRNRSVVFALACCWAIILAYGSVIGFEGIIKRFTEIGQDAWGRFKIWQYTWKLICDHWLTGTGAGTYQPAVYLYQFFDSDLVYINAAHNDYLQIVSEWGLPFGLLIFLMVWGYWLLAARRAAGKDHSGMRGQKQATGAGMRRDEDTGAPTGNRGWDTGTIETNEKLIRVGALAGAAAFLSHMWVEFNWQIPANQLYFIIVLVLMRYKSREF